ncbi:MAG: F0F1 ATP synthase subunit gamma [Alphaproteobacteria bacterium]|nr:F0F1 ATP synthase subunit gamma [Alphaproteobacteria bacterium]
MASLKDLRNRITSVQSTRKITKAMQMVAAAKLRRAQEAAESSRPYAERMDKVMANLAKGVSDPKGASPLLVGTGKDDKHLLVMMTAERGLCGGFNTNIAKLVRQDAKKLISKGKSVQILAVGRKGADNLKRDLGQYITDRVSLAGLKKIGFDKASEVADKVMSGFADGDFDVCTIYFSQFESVISQTPTGLQLIPGKLPEAGDAAETTDSVSYEYEPEENEILDQLLRRNISTQIFRGLLENAASEQGARMSAMDNATRNASDMIDSLTLSYNRQRQAQITKELIEIISGAEAL